MAEDAVTASSGVVINVHQLGATVRLNDGSLATIPASELGTHRPAIVASFQRREPIELSVERGARHNVAYVARAADAPPLSGPRLIDAAFEAQMNRYLKETEEWAPPDRPPPAERHFIRKKRRAALFESRKKA